MGNQHDERGAAVMPDKIQKIKWNTVKLTPMGTIININSDIIDINSKEFFNISHVFSITICSFLNIEICMQM